METKKLTPFTVRVLGWIRKIPRGKVATYAQIAALSGKPGAARGVTWILHSCSESHSLPWFRVINSKGKISFPKGSRNFKAQKAYLLKEGITFDSQEGIDLLSFQWMKRAKSGPIMKTNPKMFS